MDRAVAPCRGEGVRARGCVEAREEREAHEGGTGGHEHAGAGVVVGEHEGEEVVDVSGYVDVEDAESAGRGC